LGSNKIFQNCTIAEYIGVDTLKVDKKQFPLIGPVSGSRGAAGAENETNRNEKRQA